MRILYVEDQHKFMAILTAALEGIGYEVIPASTGGQAIDLFTSQAIDGVLVEHHLADAPGNTLRAKLKAIHPEIPVLLFTGISRQTPLMLRFFDSYLRNPERVGSGLEDLGM